MFGDNFSKGLFARSLTGCLVFLVFFTLGLLFYDHINEEGKSVKRDRLHSYLQSSSELISSELLRKIQEYQVDTYGAIDKKMKSSQEENRQKLLAWSEGGRRYSFFSKTNVEDIRFLTGGLYSETIVPEGDDLGYILRFPAETLKKKFYITLTAPGNLGGYLLSELNIDELLDIMKLDHDPNVVLDSFLVTSLNKIVLSSDRKSLGQDLSDVLIRKYEFYNTNNLIETTENNDSQIVTGDATVIHGLIRLPMEAGGRTFAIVLVGKDVSTEFTISQFSKNKSLFFIVVLFLISSILTFMAMRNRRRIPEFLKAVVDKLPMGTLLKDDVGTPIIWNKKN